MTALLYLAHRIPYPPNKGDKIRSFNFLKHLGQDYQVYLGAFIDDPRDWRYKEALQELCSEVFLVGMKPVFRKIRSLTGMFSGEALTLPYYRHRAMQVWVNETIKRQSIDRALIYSSAMAQYVMRPGADDRTRRLHKIVDFVDVDSEKWRQYSDRHRWPMSWIYSREGKKLLDYDRRVASDFDISIFVTHEEAELFRSLAPEAAAHITHLNNGVDTEYFSPDQAYPNPYAAGDHVLVFTGAMDYWANVDAVTWFANEVMPRVRERVPAAKFYIVGSRPTDTVYRLGALPGVHVTGAVRDIRPYLAHAAAAVAPLRIARGVQNKVLEAMAMARAVVVTPQGFDGIVGQADSEAIIAETANDFATAVIKLLGDPDKAAQLGQVARKHIERTYAWENNLQALLPMLERK